MKKSVILLVGWLLAFLWIGSADIWAQDAGDYFTIVGMVKDKQNKRTLENVNVSVQGSNIGTVTNAEGEFALKVRKEEVPRELEISHIGYINSHIGRLCRKGAVISVYRKLYLMCRKQHTPIALRIMINYRF